MKSMFGNKRGWPLALGLLTVLLAPGALGGLSWTSPGTEKERAAEAKKPILYVFTADWCGHCNNLKSSVFADAEKARQIAEWFVVVEVSDTSQERGSNTPEVSAILRRYGVSSLPTMIATLPDGTEYSRLRGYYGPGGSWRWLAQKGEAGQRKVRENTSAATVPAP